MDPSAKPQVPQPSVSPPMPPVSSVVSPAPAQDSPQPAAVAGPVVTAVATTPTPEPITTSKGKETSPISQEVAGFVEVAGADAFEKEPLPVEVSSWMEKVSRDNSDSKPPEIVIADKTANAPTGQYASAPVFVLPLGEAELQKGLHKSVNDSVRWLSVWCKKMLKQLGNRVVFNS